MHTFNDVCFLPNCLRIEFMNPLKERHREKAVWEGERVER
jgi:hypothetical protein